MALRKSSVLKIPEFNFGLSYRLDEKSISFSEAKNILINQGRIEKRYGLYPLSSAALSSYDGLFFFKNNNNERSYLVKSGPNFSKLDITGSVFNLLPFTGAVDGKFRALTWINRAIIADPGGLFQFDGNSITKTGSNTPIAPTLSSNTSGASLDAGEYTVKLTFYSSKTGYESNPSSQSAPIIIALGDSILVNNTNGTNDNSTVDRVFIYLRKSTQVDWVFCGDISLNTSVFNISINPTSSRVPPIGNNQPPTGGVKYLASFNRKLVISGIEQYPNEVWFSNTDDPESFDDAGIRLSIPGDGPVTGISVGLFNNTVLDPYLVIFKKNKTFIYSEIGDQARFIEINGNIGCSSHDTIVTRNGNIYFMSQYGWYSISNGKIVEKRGQPYQLGNYLIGEIFESKDFDLRLNKNKMKDFFSVYFHTQDIYVTFICESGSNLFKKAYVYHFQGDFFTTWEFGNDFEHGIIGESISGQEVILLTNTIHKSGFQSNVIYKIGKENKYTDSYYIEDDLTLHDFPIECNAVINWQDSGDYDSTMNFRELIIRAQRNQPNIQVRSWVNYSRENQYSIDYSFPDPESSFTLDVSLLDVDKLEDGRGVVTSRNDVNLCGESILIGFYQNIIDANMVICSAQLYLSRNGNRNI